MLEVSPVPCMGSSIIVLKTEREVRSKADTFPEMLVVGGGGEVHKDSLMSHSQGSGLGQPGH